MAQTVYGIQVLRGLAAALVVVVHLGRALQLKAGIDPTAATFNGGVGVDLFFVVSGFVMVRATPRPMPVRVFMARRLARIAPLYWLITFCYGMALLAAPGLSSFNSFKLDNFLAAFVFIPTRSAAGNILPPLEQGWTLAYEMFFYVCFAVASAVAFERRVTLLACVFGLLAVCGTALPLGDGALAATYTNALILEFAAGCVLGKLCDPDRPAAGPRTAAAAVALAACGVAASPFLTAAGWPRVACWGGPATLTVWAFLQVEHAAEFKRMRAARALGDASYAVYLTHVLVLSVMALVFEAAWARGVVALLLAPLFVLACLLAGWLVHLVVERPLTDAARRLLGAGRSRPAPTSLAGAPPREDAGVSPLR